MKVRVSTNQIVTDHAQPTARWSLRCRVGFTSPRGGEVGVIASSALVHCPTTGAMMREACGGWWMMRLVAFCASAGKSIVSSRPVCGLGS